MIATGTYAAGAVQGEGGLKVSGTLELAGPEASQLAAVTMAGGRVTGAGTIEITKTLTWESGQFKGSGSTIVAAGAEATSTGTFSLLERRIVNKGLFLLSNGSIEMWPGAEIVNEGTFRVNSQHAAGAIERGAAGPKFVNKGTLQKLAGTGESNIFVPVENEGAVSSSSGNLKLERGGSATAAARFEGTGGGVMCFTEGTFSISGSTWVGRIDIAGSSAPVVNAENVSAGAAQVHLDASAPGAAFSVQSGDMTVEELTVHSGSQRGAGTLKISKSFNWTGGSLSGAGSTILMPAAEGTVTGTFLSLERRLVNRSVLKIPAGSIEMWGATELVNEGVVTVNSEHSAAIEKHFGASAKIVNSGVFRKTAGVGTSTIQPLFENLGSIKEESGHLEILQPVSLASSNHAGHNCETADPVECATGNFAETQTDFAIGGRGIGLDLLRTYSAQAAAAAAAPGAFGYGWTNSFSDRLTSEEGGKKVRLTRADGTTTTFTQSGSAWLPPAWSQYRLTGSPESGYTLTLPSQVVFAFSGAGRLGTVTDRNGNATSLAYDGSGRLKTITDPAGRQITLTYNAESLVERAEDPLGHVVKYAYEGKNLIKVTEPGETEPRWQFKYDGSHRMTTMTDGRAGKTTNEYDSSSRVISQVDPAGRKTVFEYAPFHTKITNKATGAVTDEWFTSNNQPFSVTHGFGTAAATTQSFAYDSAGHLLTATDGNGHTTTYGYDEAGNLTSESDPLGHEAKWAYNSTHDLVSTTSPRGETTTIARDSHGNVESISRPAPGGATQTTIFAHDAHGQLESLTDPLGRTWSYGYDSYGDRTSETDPLGHVQTTTYDGDSRAVAITTPRGNLEGAEPAKFTTSIERDAQGRPLKVTDPLGAATKYAYDGNGNLASVTDPKSHTTKYTYNADDERTKVEKPTGATLLTAYDGAGYVTSQTDGNGKTTTYVRNVLERPVEVLDPLGRKTIETFDAAGNLTGLTDPAERKTTYSYDAAGRLTGIDYSEEATPDSSFEYDADGNVVAMTDGTGESTFAYDQLGRLTGSENGHGQSVEYSYDLGEEQTGVVYPNGKAVSREYDAAGRLESLTDWLGGTTSFGYDADSNLTGIVFPVESGNVDEYAYDGASRMSGATFKKGAETLASLSYVRDALGQVEKEARSGLPGPEEVSYGYDQNNRLTEAGSASFEYDAADNLTKGIGSTNTYDAASQLETGTGLTYTYDKLGERTKSTPSSGPATTYGYDQAGNLISVSRPEEGEVPAIAETMTYDATGLLATKTTGLATKHLSWDQSAELPLLLSDEENSYVYGPSGLPIEQISATEEPTYLHHDQLGSTRMLSNEAGEVSATFSYAPYGGLEGRTGSAATPLGFTSQYTDEATGSQYLRARFYDPATGQFLTRDPIERLTRETYSYAHRNPLTSVDPSGLLGELVEGGCVAGEVVDPLGGCGPGALAGGTAETLKSAGAALLGWLSAEADSGEESSTSSDEEGEDLCLEPPTDPWEQKAERGTRGEVKREEAMEIDKLGHSRNANPEEPGWQPTGSRPSRIGALLGKLLGQFSH